MGRNSTRGQGAGLRDKGQGIRPKRSLTLKTKFCSSSIGNHVSGMGIHFFWYQLVVIVTVGKPNLS